MKVVSVMMLVAVSVAGCARPIVMFERVDGQLTKSNPVLRQQWEIDSTICDGHAQEATFPSGHFYYHYRSLAAKAAREEAMWDIYKACLAKRGYLPSKKS